ncbi:MAG: alpha-hydroxy acid oxidase [Steroidobacteraceae bacterium]|jgi:isopentenyl diphosphate isomerase/L-lactate dehydrogenase-like FMN-dependent dehydrogenase
MKPSVPAWFARREFLKLLAASPYVVACGGLAGYLPKRALAQIAQGVPPADTLIGTAAEAVDVFDLEPVAQRKVQAGHWAYMVSGVDADATVRANREGFEHVQLRPRRLRDASRIDMHVDLFGTLCNGPIFTCPTGGEKSFHAEGELAVARAAKARGAVQILSTSTSTSVESVNEALGRPAWFQLYAPASWEICQKIVRRVEAAGCSVLVLTVDNNVGRKSDTYLHMRPKDLRQCAGCHTGSEAPGTAVRERPMYDGIDMTGVSTQNAALDWVFLDRLRNSWKGKLVIKGLDTGEDARLCLQHGVDGILVSNHGGRSTDSGRATIEALPEVVAAVGGRIPILIDGGFRRGVDVFKALALGAKAVGIGRPMLWGLGAFGQSGVERVLEIMQGELELVMGNCGTQSLAQINRAYVATPDWKS